MGLFGSKKETVDAGPAPLAEYKVVYRGGLPELPKAKVGGIELRYWPDRLTLDPTAASKKWWEHLEIPYAAIGGFTIEKRQVGTAETLLSAGKPGGTRDLATDNNLHISYTSQDGQPMLLRLEMLTGVTVGGQAKKCTEMVDLLRVHRILDQLTGPTTAPAAAGGSVADELAKLAALREQGILSEDEFAASKARLLGA